MKRKHSLMVVIAALLLAAALVGCSAQPAKITTQDGAAPPAAAAPAASAAGTSDSAGDESKLPVIDPGSAAAYGKKVIYTVDMSVEAKDASATLEDLSTTAAGLGGYVSDMQYDEASHTGWITVRVAPEKLKELIGHVGALGKVLNQNMTSQDVTDQYYDVQSRLTNAQAQEAQLLDIMKQAVKIDDILKVRAELDTVEQEIEQLKGQIRLMDNQVGFSTVKISVQQPKPPAVTVDPKGNNPGVQFWGFEAIGQKIAHGASDSFNWTLNAIGAVLMALSYVIVPLLLIAIVALAIIFIVRMAGKKKKKSQ